MSSAETRKPQDERTPLLRDRQDAEAHDESKGELSRTQFWLLIAALYSCFFLAAIDGSIVNVLAQPISGEFGHAELFSALGSSYLGASCAFTPLFSRFSDLYGRRIVILVAGLLFLAGTVACALAQSIEAFIAARVIEGIGGGGLLSLSMIIQSDLVSNRSRGIYAGVSNLFFSSGVAFGGPLGGAIYKAFGWRWAFVVQIPIALVALIGFATLIRIPGTGKAKIDWAGSALSVVGLLALVSSLQLGGQQLPWDSPIIIGGFVLAAVSIVGFVVAEKYAAQPIISLKIITNPTIALCALSNSLSGILILATVWLLPTTYIAFLGMTPFDASVHLIPGSVAAATSSLIGGWITRRTGTYRIGLFASLFACVTPAVLQTWSRDPRTPEAHLYLDFIFTGIANGAAMNSISVDEASQAQATGISSLSRQLGQVLGTTLAGAALGSQTSHFPPEWKKNVLDLPPEGRDAYGEALKFVFRIVLGIAIAATITTCSIPSRPLRDGKPKK